MVMVLKVERLMGLRDRARSCTVGTGWEDASHLTWTTAPSVKVRNDK